MINKGESEIHGCKVNVTWIKKEICTITKSTVRFREIKPRGDQAEWTEYNVSPTTSYLLYLGCDKEYEIAVSSWFELEKFKATGQSLVNSKPALQVRHYLMYTVCPIADRDLVLTKTISIRANISGYLLAKRTPLSAPPT